MAGDFQPDIIKQEAAILINNLQLKLIGIQKNKNKKRFDPNEKKDDKSIFSFQF